ncbi:MAG: thioesterase family protein [Flavobacteriaceae bacterium]|nr:thioesterase family protein [Flavobacteriaceae bacterium]
MYIKEFEVRWNDLDANRHLANSAYINFAAHTRMAYLIANGFNQKVLAKHNIGPVVFFEHIYYFKEVFGDQPVQVSLELEGLSEDGKFFEFVQNFYNFKGRNVAHYEMMGGWICLKTRKLIALPDEISSFITDAPKSKNFKVLTKEDTRKFMKMPVDLVL